MYVFRLTARAHAAAFPRRSDRLAELLLKEIASRGSIRTTYPYPVQLIRFGQELTLVALAGEVVVDYSLRLKSELKHETRAVWVAGYSNDVFGYVPSLRVLSEGGYEGGGAMRYTALPGPFAANVEDQRRLLELDLLGEFSRRNARRSGVLL